MLHRLQNSRFEGFEKLRGEEKEKKKKKERERRMEDFSLFREVGSEVARNGNTKTGCLD